MYRFFGEQSAYSLFNTISMYVPIVVSFIFLKTKTNELGLYSRYAVFYASKKSLYAGTILKYFLACIELLLLTAGTLAITLFNYPFGDIVGTGVNYFGGLFSFSFLGLICSVIIMANPMKQMDIVAPLLPLRLVFLKIACYFNGCCWGIPWEYGPYNHHYDHPGNQVPVQAIEAFWAFSIFVFLLIYRKKAKPGTIYPMYIILYSATRFCSEFFRREENVLWIFKRYHLLCLAGVTIGLVLLFIVKIWGNKIQNLFEKPHKNLDLKIAQYKNQQALKLAEERAQAENERLDRLEKAKLAREKANTRKK